MFFYVILYSIILLYPLGKYIYMYVYMELWMLFIWTVLVIMIITIIRIAFNNGLKCFIFRSVWNLKIAFILGV